MGKTKEIAEMSAWYFHELHKETMVRSPKEGALASVEDGRELASMPESRGLRRDNPHPRLK
jgi:hypothetical protein